MRSLLRYLLLCFLFVPTWGIARSECQLTPPGYIRICGALTVRSRMGAPLPDYFVVTFRSHSLELAQRVGHLENFDFRVPDGTYDAELTVSANATVLLRQKIEVDSDRLSSCYVNLLAEWNGVPPPTSNGMKAVSARDFYPHKPANAVLMKRVTAAVDKRRYPEAANLLKKIVATDPDDFEAWTDLGTVLFKEGDQHGSAKALERALEVHPSYPLALLYYGKLQFVRRQCEASIDALIRLLNMHSEVAEGYRYLGEAYLCIKDGAKAVPQLERAVRLDPAGQADAYLSLAELYDATGHKAKAAAELEYFLALRPEHPDRNKFRQYILNHK